MASFLAVWLTPNVQYSAWLEWFYFTDVQFAVIIASGHAYCGCMQIVGLEYLVPQEGSVVTSCLVVMDDDHETGLPYPAAVEKVKQQMLEGVAQVFNMQSL